MFQLIYFIIYHLEWPFFEQYKVNSTPWPWQVDTTTEEGRDALSKWRWFALKSTLTAQFNSWLGSSVNIFFWAFASNWQMPWVFHPNQYPSPWTMFLQIVFIMITEDFGFYWGHRICHFSHPWFNLYKWIHKKHHEYSLPIAVSCTYCHILEQIFVNTAPFYAGVILCGYM